MDESINELFSVILHSEKVALDEKKRCKEVKEKIENIHMRLEKQAEAKKECMKNIENLTSGFFQSNLGLQLLKEKEESLCRKLKMIQKEISADKEKLENLEALCEKSLKAFMSSVKDFTNNYGISSHGKNIRELQARATVRSLAAKKDCLTDELEGLKKRNREIMDVTNGLQKITETKNLMEIKRKECEHLIEAEECEISKLKIELHHLETQPEIDKSFISLSNELQQYQTLELEMRARDMQTQLNELLKAKRQKEGQKLRQQYRKWQRQRQQMMHLEKEKQENQIT